MWLWLRRLFRIPTIIITRLWICREKYTLSSIVLNAHGRSLLLKEVWDNLGHQGAENNPTGRGELPGEGRLLGMLWMHWMQLPQLLDATMKWSSKNADFPNFLEKRFNWGGKKKKYVFFKESIPVFTSNKTKWLAFERLKASQKRGWYFFICIKPDIKTAYHWRKLPEGWSTKLENNDVLLPVASVEEFEQVPRGFSSTLPS